MCCYYPNDRLTCNLIINAIVPSLFGASHVDRNTVMKPLMLGGNHSNHKGSTDSQDSQINNEVPANSNKFFSQCLKLRQENKI